MENRTRNIVMSILFFLFIIFLIIGGYIYIKQLGNEDVSKKDTITSKKEIDYRLDKDKDYIYFENEDIVSVDPEITFSDVVLNIDGADIINSTLKSEMEEIRKSVVKLDETNKDESKTLLYDDIEIFSSKERTYELHKTRDYYSVVISTLDFNCYTDFLITDIKSYILDIKEGKILTNENLLNKYGVSMDVIKEKVSSKLDASQSVTEEGIEVINKEETLNTLFDSYALYINGSDLYISYIVKSNIVNYNDSVRLN